MYRFLTVVAVRIWSDPDLILCLLNVTCKPVCRPVCKLRQSKHLIWIYYQEVGPANDETCVINVVFLLGQIVAEVLLFVSQRST